MQVAHKAAPRKRGIFISRIFSTTNAFISSTVMPGWVKRPSAKQKLQYLALFDPSALVPPPYGSCLSGMPQLWQFS